MNPQGHFLNWFSGRLRSPCLSDYRPPVALASKVSFSDIVTGRHTSDDSEFCVPLGFCAAAAFCGGVVLCAPAGKPLGAC